MDNYFFDYSPSKVWCVFGCEPLMKCTSGWCLNRVGQYHFYTMKGWIKLSLTVVIRLSEIQFSL